MENLGGRSRICLITPGHLTTNPRLIKEADALSGAGYEVSVIAGRFIAWADEADSEFAGRLWKVRRIPFGPMAGNRKRLVQGLRYRASRALVRLLGVNIGDAALGIHPAIPDLARAALQIPAHLYIAHNLAALPAAYAAARRHGARLGFDAEDFHSGEIPVTPSNAFQIRITHAFESKFLPQCDYMTASSPGIALEYVRRYGVERPTVVLNVFSKSLAPTGPTARGATCPGPSLYWFSQTIGPGRGLETVIDALPLMKSRPILYLRGRPAEGYRGFLERLAARRGVADRLRILPLAGAQEMVKLAAVFDIGLATEPDDTRNHELCLSNKLFTYILAGIPVVLSSTPAQEAIARDVPGAAFLFPQGDASSIAKIVDELLERPRALWDARCAAWRYGQRRFNWETEREPFLTRIHTTLRLPPCAASRGRT